MMYYRFIHKLRSKDQEDFKKIILICFYLLLFKNFIKLNLSLSFSIYVEKEKKRERERERNNKDCIVIYL